MTFRKLAHTADLSPERCQGARLRLLAALTTRQKRALRKKRQIIRDLKTESAALDRKIERWTRRRDRRRELARVAAKEDVAACPEQQQEEEEAGVSRLELQEYGG
jgi:DNA-binding PadR family transcriptional regulator